jgi:hypothetical protein
MPHIRFLLDRLEEPFEMFPMQSVSRDLTRLVSRTEESRFDRSGQWGHSPGYDTVEDEHDVEVVQLLIGSTFVLGQAAITQAVSIVRKMHALAGEPGWIPFVKDEIMSLGSPVHTETGLKKIPMINAVANYFKHHYEWWDDWSGPRPSLPTIDIVAQLGLGPKAQRNLETALREFGMMPDNMGPLAQLMVEWREKLAAHLRDRLDKHGM